MDIVSGRDIVGDDPDELLRAIVSGPYDDGIEGEVGYDGRDIVGAIARALQGRAQQARRAPGAPQATFNGKQLDPAKWRRLPAPMPVTSIAAGATVDITIKPQKLFRAEFLIATESTASKLFINGVTVQGENQLVTGGEIPVASFAPTVLLNNKMQLKTADIGAEINLKVRNSDTAAVTFAGTLFGEAYVD